MFDLYQFISSFDSANREHYFGELIRKAETQKLYEFKDKVKAHRKKSRFIQDLHYMPGMSVHDSIISAIDFELLKRSKWYQLYRLTLPFRKKVVSWFSGIDIEEHPYCGALYRKRQNKKTFLHITGKELLQTLKSFWLEHWKWILTTIVAIIGIYLKFTGKI